MLANDNYLYLLSGGNFFELMKFLLSNLESKVDNLEVDLGNGVFKLISSGKNIDLPFMADSKNQEDLVTSIVSLCPKKITIYNGKTLNAVVEDFLTNPEAYEGDENKLQGVFNNIELVKDLASIERQKAACAAATDMLFDIAGHAF